MIGRLQKKPIAPSTWKRVIIFRSARPVIVMQIIDSLKRQGMAPESITILEPQNTSHAELKRLFGPCNPIYLPSGSFRLWKLSPLLLHRLRTLQADAFIIPYNNQGKLGYHHIELLGLLSKARNVIGLDGATPAEHIRINTLFQRETAEWFSVALPFMKRHPRFFYRFFPQALYPKLVGLDFTLTCNLRCNFCVKTDFTGPHLPLENIYKIASGIRYARVISLGGYGEPTIYPHFEEALRIIYKLNPRKNLIQLFTNGATLSEKMATLLAGKLYKMTISLNSSSEESYRKYMKGNLKVTKAHIKHFMEALSADDRSKVQTAFAVGAHNYREMPDFVRQAKEIGVNNVSFNQFQISKPHQLSMGLFNVKEEANALLDEAIDVGNKLGVLVYGRKFFEEHPRGLEACPYPETEMLISVSGDVIACCYAGKKIMGNVYKESFESVWFGKKFLRLRRERHLPQCKECVPLLTYDNYQTHFFSLFKETEEYRQIEREIILERNSKQTAI